MPSTKDVRETIRKRAERDPEFRAALLNEAEELILSGDKEIGESILRNYITKPAAFPRLP